MEGLVSKRAAIRIPFSEDGFVSIVFVIAKGSGGFRPVINLKKSNVYIKYEKFKMEGLQSLRHLVRPNDWMPKIELKDAYLEFQKFLRFVWEGKYYQGMAMPFGLSSAPRTFTKLMKLLIEYLRRRGIRLIIYLTKC